MEKKNARHFWYFRVWDGQSSNICNNLWQVTCTVFSSQPTSALVIVKLSYLTLETWAYIIFDTSDLDVSKQPNERRKKKTLKKRYKPTFSVQNNAKKETVYSFYRRRRRTVISIINITQQAAHLWCACGPRSLNMVTNILYFRLNKRWEDLY